MGNNEETTALAKKLTPEGTGLTDAQVRAVELIQQGGKTFDAIAQEVGVHRKTLFAWRQRDDFRGAIAAIEEAGIAEARSYAAKYAKHVLKRHIIEGQKTGECARKCREFVLQFLGGKPGEGALPDQAQQMVVHFRDRTVIGTRGNADDEK